MNKKKVIEYVTSKLADENIDARKHVLRDLDYAKEPAITEIKDFKSFINKMADDVLMMLKFDDFYYCSSNVNTEMSGYMVGTIVIHIHVNTDRRLIATYINTVKRHVDDISNIEMDSSITDKTVFIRINTTVESVC